MEEAASLNRDYRREIHAGFQSLQTRVRGSAEATGDPVDGRSLVRSLRDLQELVDSALTGLSPEQSRSAGAAVADRRSDVPLPVLGPSLAKDVEGEESQQDRGEFLSAVIESLGHPFLVIDAADFSIKLANSAARAVGPPEATHCFELTHHRTSPCDGQEHPCPLVAVKRTGRPVCVEHIHFTRDGEPRHVEVHGHPVFDSKGRLVQLIEYCLDITERKRAESMLLGTRDLMVFAMARLTESRDPETGEHLERMRSYSMLLGEELSRTGPYAGQIDRQFLDDLYRASPLHDIGKVGIPDAILLKPGQLNTAEFEIMKQHATIGAEALERICDESDCGSFLTMAAGIARAHHERFNGGGYPDGLAGTKIPLAARIVALADVYDALTSARVYKRAFEPESARLMIENESGKHFDPVIVAAFLARWKDFLAVRGG